MRIAATSFSAAVLALTTALGPAGSEPFSLQISAVQERVQSGSQVALNLTLTNNPDGQITIVDIDRWCDYSLEVHDGQGQAVPETASKRERKCPPWPPVAFCGGCGLRDSPRPDGYGNSIHFFCNILILRGLEQSE